MQISINRQDCIRCGHCASVCPSGVLLQKDTNADILIHHTDHCIRCGHCVDVCPEEVITHEAFPEGTVHKVDRSLLPSPDSLMELIKARRSNRTFTDREIPEDVLNKIIEAARFAPTAENSRKVGITVIKTPEALQKVEKGVMDYFMDLVHKLTKPVIKQIVRAIIPDTFARIPELLSMNEQYLQGRRPASVNAKVILVFHAPKNYDFGSQDCNLAYQNASLMAETLGISQVYLGFVQTAMKMMGTKKAASILGIPKDHKPYALMALGIPRFTYFRYSDR